MTQALWEAMGSQLRQPRGAWGGVTGRIMRLVNARVNALAVNSLAAAPGEHVIEIGCGPGHALKLVLAASSDVTVAGLDHSPVMIAQAASLNSRPLAAGRLTLQVGDFSAMPFPDASADAVLAVNVAYFMRDGRALDDVWRVLKPCGRLVLYATHRQSMQNWRFAGDHSHRTFDEEDMRALLSEAGFAPAEIRSVDAGLGVKGLIAVGRRKDSHKRITPL